MLFALILFLSTYVLMILFTNHRTYIAVGSAILFVLFGILPWDKVAPAIDFNVLMMIAGTMGTVGLFIESRMPGLLADHIIDKLPSWKWVILALSVFAGLISAFVDNVATVLMVVPVALTICQKLGKSPIRPVIAIAIASNLEGAATLVGDTTSILLGGYADMNFADFFFYAGQPGLFWIVQISLILATAMLWRIFRKENDAVQVHVWTEVTNYVPTFLLIGTIAGLILVSFLPNMPELINGFVCMGFLLLGFLIEGLRFGFKATLHLVWEHMDYYTLALLAGLFVVIGGIKEAGVIDAIAQSFVKVGGENIFIMYSLITFASVILSAFIDNIPYVATMLPVVVGIASHMGIEPTILYFGLLSGATLGGNLTPIGASANIAALGILKKEGYQVKNTEFMKISVPYTLTAVLSGYLMIWFLFS